MKRQDWEPIKAKIQASGIDRRDLAEAMGLTPATLNNRIYGWTPWSAEELVRLDKIIAVTPTT